VCHLCVVFQRINGFEAVYASGALCGVTPLSEIIGFFTNSSRIIFPGAYYVIPSFTENLNNSETGKDIALAT